MDRLVVKNAEKHFGKNGLNPVSFSLNNGEYLCITGESGCGKTTLLNIISGMLRPDSGEILVYGKNIFTELSEKERTKLRSTKIGYMMQGNVLIPELDVLNNIRMPVELSGRSIDKSELQKLLEILHITHIQKSYPSEVSGGEYRRVILARTLMLHTDILLADEPTSNLDASSAEIVRDVLNEYANENHILIVSTHDSLLAMQARKNLCMGY